MPVENGLNHRQPFWPGVLPVQLSPENDAKLVEEGVLPPVDEEGYEVLPAGEEEVEYYDE